MATEPDEYIQINSALSLKPSLGPIPADQMFPWAVIVLGNIFVVKSLLGLSWIITILSIGWGIATWWILTGSDGGRFLSKFHAPPMAVPSTGHHWKISPVYRRMESRLNTLSKVG